MIVYVGENATKTQIKNKLKSYKGILLELEYYKKQVYISNTVENRVKELEGERDEILKLINCIENGDISSIILIYRYVAGMKIKEICKSIGYSDRTVIRYINEGIENIHNNINKKKPKL